MHPKSYILNPKSPISSDIYQEILSALEHEESIMLATIISTSGSTPASALSKMLIKNGGTVSVGTVGGGCMEGEVILHANRLYNARKAEILTFELNEDDIESGLICGGNLDILIEPITKNFIPIFQKLKTLRDDEEDCIVGTLLNKDNTVASKIIFKRNSGEMNEWIVDNALNNSTTQLLPHSITPLIQQSISRVYQKNEIIRLKTESGEIILEPISSTPSLIIFGGGHVSKFVSQSAVMVGFRVTIVDDREKYANPDRFPEAAQTIVSDFSEAFSKLTIKPTTYIVIVTRGHSYDELVLEQAVKTPAKYIGMIGSKRKVLKTYDHLRQCGIKDEQLERVHAPIGIDIAAATAEEIAVSITAELVRIRRGSLKPPRHLKEDLGF
ncbi:MAG: XdhC family protein [Ignavibacteriales bacterium]|nr:XdhC family protein [Ignavibacteriales bacterium]